MSQISDQTGPRASGVGPDVTVEWGEPKLGWVTRMLGNGTADDDRARRVNPVGMGCALAAFALVLAAELVPWMVADMRGSDSNITPGGSGVGFYLGQIGSFPAIMYDTGWMALFALVAVNLVSSPPTRSLFGAAAVGVAAGQVALLVGLARAIKQGGGLFGDTGSVNLINQRLGPGIYAAFAAVALAVIAVGLSGLRPGRRRAQAAEPEFEAGPADLTVTPLPASHPIDAR